MIEIGPNLMEALGYLAFAIGGAAVCWALRSEHLNIRRIDLICNGLSTRAVQHSTGRERLQAFDLQGRRIEY